MFNTQPKTNRTWQVALVAALALVAAACGSDSASTDTADTTAAPTTEAPTTTEAAMEDDAMEEGDAMEEAGAPARVVSLSPTHTEIMFAIGAGDLLVAVDQFSNYPAEALELPNELSGFEPNVEAIASYEPDLVLIGGDFSGLGEQLDAIGIGWWDGPAAGSLSDTYAQIEQLGAATGHIAEAAELVSSMQTRIDELVAAAPAPDVPVTFFHELDPTLFSADSSTFIGELYGLLGLENIADVDGGASGGFPQLSAEVLVEQNPDLIFLADTKCCGETADTVAARDGWADIAAVANGNVFEMDDDVASRWGPRVVEYLEAISTALDQALAGAS